MDKPIDRDEPLVAAIDLGGTKLMIGVVTHGGKLIHTRTIPTPLAAGPEGCLDAAYREFIILCGEANIVPSQIDRVGAAVPGLADPVLGILRHAPYAGWRDVPMARGLEDRFGVPATIANDVNGAALAERRFGVGQDCDDYIWITWSTGIGGAVVVQGKLYEGSHGFAGELGHLVVEEGGPVCGCGNRGCLEAVAAGVAIGRMGPTGCGTTAADVATAARAGHVEAMRVMTTAAGYLGRGIAFCVNVLNPERVIIGGGVARSLDLVLPHLKEVVRDRVIGEDNKTVAIMASGLGYHASLLGAAAITLPS